jgi:ectoine hydroxylase-related dioxygenase (phytanoyl-CoA dioxygenase family)
MLSAEQVAEFLERGFVIVRGRFSERAVALCQELERMLGSLDCPKGHYGRRFGSFGFASSHRFGGLMGTNAAFGAHARDPEIVEAVGRLLGPATAFRDVVLSKPGHSGGTLAAHQDLAYWDVGHERVLTTWLAMTPALLDSGALWLLPGSHLRTFEHRTVIHGRPMPRLLTRGLRTLVSLTGTGDSPRNAEERRWARLKEVSLEGLTRRWPALAGLGDLQILDEDMPAVAPVRIEAQPGDMVLFHGRTIHGSFANRLDTRRDAYLVTYVGSA